VAVSPDPQGALGQQPGQPDGQAPAPGEGQQPTPDGSPEPQPQTVEEVQAIWQNRFSQRDRAHNAEVESLRRQLAEASGQPSAPATAAGEPGSTPTDSYKARFEATQQELEQVRRQATVNDRRARYPALAGEIAATDPVWAQANDESLARMNALAGTPAKPPPTGPIDANQPSRQPVMAKDPSQMSKDELLQELSRMSPAEQARWREMSGGSGF
jgi:hypothetical protein